MTANELRQALTDYFVSKGHTHVKSSPLVPEDPTLILANAASSIMAA